MHGGEEKKEKNVRKRKGLRGTVRCVRSSAMMAEFTMSTECCSPQHSIMPRDQFPITAAHPPVQSPSAMFKPFQDHLVFQTHNHHT